MQQDEKVRPSLTSQQTLRLADQAYLCAVEEIADELKQSKWQSPLMAMIADYIDYLCTLDYDKMHGPFDEYARPVNIGHNVAKQLVSQLLSDDHPALWDATKTKLEKSIILCIP